MDRIAHAGEVFDRRDRPQTQERGARPRLADRGVPLPRNGSDTTGYVIYRDITESKRLQDEQRRYHEIQLELAHANRISTRPRRRRRSHMSSTSR